MKILTCVILVLLPCVVPAAFNVGDRVLARWTNHLYYRGKVDSFPSSGAIKIKYDDGDEITHPVEDGSAVIADKAPDTVDVRDHVMATWKRGSKYYLGFIIEERESHPKYKVFFDDGDSDWYNLRDLRKFPVLDKRQVGARVWGFYRWHSSFYRGFVNKVQNYKVHVLFDEGGTAFFYFGYSLDSNVVLDELPQAGRSYMNSEVIAYWPGEGENKFFKGTVTDEKPGSYYVSSGWNKRWEEIYQLRPM